MESSLHPQGVQASYPGAANPTTSNTDEAPGQYSEANQIAKDAKAASEGGGEGIESKPGIIEQTELAPLGEGKVASDPGLVAQATSAAKKAYTAVVGESK